MHANMRSIRCARGPPGPDRRRRLTTGSRACVRATASRQSAAATRCHHMPGCTPWGGDGGARRPRAPWRRWRLGSCPGSSRRPATAATRPRCRATCRCSVLSASETRHWQWRWHRHWLSRIPRWFTNNAPTYVYIYMWSRYTPHCNIPWTHACQCGQSSGEGCRDRTRRRPCRPLRVRAAGCAVAAP